MNTPTHITEQILNSVEAYIYTKDLAGKYTYANQEVLALFGKTLAEVVGHGDEEFFDLSLSVKLKENDRKVISQGIKVVSEESNYIKSLNEIRIYRVVKKPIFDDEGVITGMCGISTDITSERKIQQRAEEQKHLLDTILNNINAHVYMKDSERTFLYVNSQVAELFGDSAKNIIGKKTVWTANADNQGVALGYENSDTVKELGPVYGCQWRSWKGCEGQSIDQVTQLINQIKNNPDSRRLILSAWNVGEIDKMALPPCHTFFQFYVANGKLSCQLYQRSADIFLGVPFNIASYALLTMMIAQVCELEVGDFVHTFGDAHLYSNHLDQAKLQISRTPYQKPTMKINKDIKNIFDFTMDDFELSDYEAHPHIKGEMAV